jgi:hypothetical protein
MKTAAAYLCCVFLLCTSFGNSNKLSQHTGILQLNIELVFNRDTLVLNNHAYINAHGDTLYIDGFRFYISGVKLRHPKSKTYSEKESYHLIDADDKASQELTLTDISEGTYDELTFLLGTDSLANVSGAMAGDLDPTKGMYWAWNTGYINAKLEGHASVCKTIHHAFEFHIGGYLSPYKSVREVRLAINEIQIAAGKTITLKLEANAAEWFKHTTLIDLSKTNSIVIPGKEAMMMADNYSDMFRVSK